MRVSILLQKDDISEHMNKHQQENEMLVKRRFDRGWREEPPKIPNWDKLARKSVLNKNNL